MKKIIVLLLGLLFVLTQPVLAAEDRDADQLNDSNEAVYMTNPDNPDTDKDGYQDGLEVKNGYSPLAGKSKKLLDIDTDKDGLNDAWEIALSTDLSNSDTDGDGHKDGEEVMKGFDPRSADKKVIAKIIKVDLAKQKLAYYFGDRKLEEFLISSGLKSMPTPKGEFKILTKIPSKTYGGTGYDFYYPNTKWNLHFHTGKLRFYIHGAYWHNKFGKPASHGCVNVGYVNMERLYDWAQVGTKVVIY